MKNLICLSAFLFSLSINSLQAQENQFLDYKIALVRGLSDTFENSLKLAPPEESINLSLAKEQHKNYIDLLRTLIEVVELDADPAHPDCNFIEDTAIAVGDDVVISRMGAEERRGEEIPVALTLSLARTKKISYLQAPATMDGGDVLYVGNHLFVGLSRRTNVYALEQLKEIFKDKLEVIGIPVTEGLHLKSILTALDSHTLVVASTEAAKQVQDLIEEETGNIYSFVVVPDEVASNVLRIKSTLIVQEGYPASEAILQQCCNSKKLKLVTINMSELIKADGALTCGNILIN